MILLDIGFQTTAGTRMDFLAVMQDMVAGSMAEAGCLTYRLTGAIDDPLVFHLLECWADEASYLAHRGGPVLTPLREPLARCAEVISYQRWGGNMAPYTPPMAG